MENSPALLLSTHSPIHAFICVPSVNIFITNPVIHLFITHPYAHTFTHPSIPTSLAGCLPQLLSCDSNMNTVVPVQTIKAQRGNGVKSPLILNFST